MNCTSGHSSAVSAGHGQQHATDIAALQNALNDNIFSTSSTLPQSIDSVLNGVKTRCAVKSSSTSSSPVKCDRYKTELCRTYEENGTCRYGDKCQFAHGVGELRSVARHPKYKTDLCRTFHTTGFCPYGSRCHFIHSLHERQVPVQQPSKLPIHAVNMLLPQIALAPPASVSSHRCFDNLLQTLSALLQTNEPAAGHGVASRLAQEQARSIAARQSAATELLAQGSSHFSDATSLSTDSASPCSSPVSFNGAYDDLSSRSYFPTSSSAVRIPRTTGFQPPSPTLHAGCILSPPNSPGSAASSLNSLSASDYDAFNAAWSRSVWPSGLLSPAKSIDINLVSHIAQRQLLSAQHSKVFA